MTQEQKDILLKDLCARLPYGVKFVIDNDQNNVRTLNGIREDIPYEDWQMCAFARGISAIPIEDIKPYLFPLSSMTDEDYAIYTKIWEDAGKTAYLGGCHHLISTIKAYKAANDYLLSKHYDINGLIPIGLAEDATGKNIY